MNETKNDNQTRIIEWNITIIIIIIIIADYQS